MRQATFNDLTDGTIQTYPVEYPERYSEVFPERVDTIESPIYSAPDHIGEYERVWYTATFLRFEHPESRDDYFGAWESGKSGWLVGRTGHELLHFPNRDEAIEAALEFGCEQVGDSE